MTTFLVLFGVVASVIGCSDNHVVRTLDTPHPDPESVDAAFDRWWDQVGSKSAKPAPLVLVATAGGASRAAYWTTKVLAQIEQDHPGFHNHVFAISSVSGGSLGAGVYRAMLNDVARDDGTDTKPSCSGKATRKNLVECGRTTIEHDFLGPTFLTGLYADLTQRFLPGSLLPDRAGALERSWETAWQSTMPKATVMLDQPFHSLWRAGEWLPALIINGTSEKTGRRIITSNLRVEKDIFPDAIDFFEREKRDIAVSTAIHNSARFPYIDAAGTLVTNSGMIDRIVDGGYFENFGASSVYDVLEKLRSASAGRPVKFFVLQITSDPELAEPAKRDTAWEKNSPFALNVSADVTAPPVALFNTGSALGYRSTEVLKAHVKAIATDGGASHYAHFRLTDKREPMSWVMSKKAVRLLDDEWARNSAPYSDLAQFMGWK